MAQQQQTINQLDYMQLLKDTLVLHNNDPGSAAIQFGIANEIINYLHQY